MYAYIPKNIQPSGFSNARNKSTKSDMLGPIHLVCLNSPFLSFILYDMHIDIGEYGDEMITTL